MRDLTKEQKKMLRRWYLSNRGALKPCCFDKVEELITINAELYDAIEELNPTEVFYHNVNHYLEELCFNFEEK